MATKDEFQRTYLEEMGRFLRKNPSQEEIKKFKDKLRWWEIGKFDRLVKGIGEARAEAGRRAERAKKPPIDPSEAIKIMPRGLQILAFDSDDLAIGFPYPAVLEKFGIPPEDWDYVLMKIISLRDNGLPLLSDPAANTIAKKIETLLDNVAGLDVAFFRRRGLIMRVDMPGEQKFGLDCMDLYHRCHRGQTSKHRFHKCKHIHVDNLSGAGTTKIYQKRFRDLQKVKKLRSTELGALQFNFHAGTHHLRRIRRRMYEGTRIVLDVLTVLDDPETAYKRGWANWIKQCQKARKRQPRDEGKPRPSFSNPEAVKDYYEPFHQRLISERIFRWPPSKQLYYDRWRGDNIASSTLSEHCRGWKWRPYKDSMDRRMKSPWHRRRCVVPADEIGVMVMKNSGLEDQCLGTHKHMVAGRFKGKKGPIYPGRRPRRAPGHHCHGMRSEHELALIPVKMKEQAEEMERWRREHGQDICHSMYHQQMLQYPTRMPYW
jgi:hypothetical protein